MAFFMHKLLASLGSHKHDVTGPCHVKRILNGFGAINVDMYLNIRIINV